jgi:hypothetical protein
LIGQNKYETNVGTRIGRPRPGAGGGVGKARKRGKGNVRTFVLVKSLTGDEGRVKTCIVANYPCNVAMEVIHPGAARYTVPVSCREGK